MYLLYLLLPLLLGALAAFICSFSSGAWRYSKYAGLGGAVASSLLTLFAFLKQNTIQLGQLQWFTAFHSTFAISLSFGYINQVLLAVVAVISPLIFFYSIGYMDVPEENSRYYAELSLFAASMMLLAVSGGFITLFIAWEGLGITSYLLIGFWTNKDAPQYAARKAITTIIIGDMMMLSGILVIFASLNTFNFSTMISEIAAMSTVPISIVAAFVLIILGAFTKSAQFPFHEWLSDAMEGPTPVSAFLHSSTMVKAGVFVVALLLPILAQLGLLNMILVFGIISAVIGALNAAGSTHIKKILAYSTIEDLGLMFIAIGLNALAAAMVLFIVQALYKALLFMNAGSIMKANDEETDLYKVSSFSKNRLLFATALIGALSIAGIFPFSGFFGKLAVDSAGLSNSTVYIVLIVLDFATGFYIFRWLFIPEKNEKKDSEIRLRAKYASQPKSMTVSQVILAALVIFLTALFLYTNIEVNVGAAIVLTAGAGFGILSAYLLFWRLAGLAWERSRTRNFLSKGFFVNAAYLAIAKGTRALSTAIEEIDYFINRIVYLGAFGVADLGNSIRRSETGIVNFYAAAVAIGIFMMLLLLVLLV
ncbi:NADH-quinone oxidoreductase subunit L [Candidatus Marsarchaeota archaeon]|jgi:NADH-quinone oxidoreductase subunit L|nr:NADH-quinone oxidoreductase subunit L [Candidatus Marsarchaeota archaeon]